MKMKVVYGKAKFWQGYNILGIVLGLQMVSYNIPKGNWFLIGTAAVLTVIFIAMAIVWYRSVRRIERAFGFGTEQA